MTERTRQQFISDLSEVMAEVGYVQKDATNTGQRYRYASAEHVLNKVRGALAERGMAVESHASLEHFEVFDTEKGKRSIAVVKLSISVTDGTHTATMEGLGEGVDAGDKAVMKADTAALKYAVASGFLISWGDDPEADPNGEEIGARAKRGVEALGAEMFADGVNLPESYPEFDRLVTLHKGRNGINDLRFVGSTAANRLHWTEERLLAWIAEQGVDLENGAQTSEFAKLKFEIEKVG